MNKIIKRISIIILLFITSWFCISFLRVLNNNNDTPIRNIELSNKSVDYQNLVSSFDDSKITYEQEKKHLTFEGYSTLKESDFESLDFVSLTNNSESELDVRYYFEYFENINLFTLGIEITNIDGGIILDKIEGIPFLNDTGEIDIVFDAEGEMILLSELVENGLIEQCGWFTRALKKALPAIVSVVAVAAVVAVAVVAVPAVIASIPTVSVVATTASTSLVLTGGGVAAGLAAGAAAATTVLPGLAIATGVVSASILAGSMVSALAEEIDIALIEQIGNDKIYNIAYLRNNLLNVMHGLMLNYYEAAYVLAMCGFINSGILGFDLLTKVVVDKPIKNIIQQLTSLNVSKNKIGVYTEKKIDAAKLAFAFGGIWDTKPEISGSLSDGYLYHFHDFNHRIHVWYKYA